MTDKSFKNKLYNKRHITQKRKVAALYNNTLLTTKITLVVLLCLFVFTNLFSGTKQQIATKLYEISASHGFKLEKIIIEGTSNIETSDIISAIEYKKDDSIFSLNMKKVHKNIEQNSWVKKAFVERRMPNTLYIAVSEKKPIALWQYKQKLVLIDEFGDKISKQNIDKFSHLPHLIGSDANIYAKQLLDSLANHSDLAKHVLYATRHGQRRWDLVLQEDITIKMPENDFAGAYDYLHQIFSKDLLFTKNIKMLDLRNRDKVFFQEGK